VIPAADVATIALMAAATYGTRVGGFLLLRNRSLGPRAKAALDAAPGCVLIAVIAPYFVSPRPADLIALAVTVIAATRLPMLPTVVIGVCAAGLLRHVIG
jgi:uncharacterized membrane protein